MAKSPASPRFSLLIDTNVLLDVILRRDPWAVDAAALLDQIARGNAAGFIASHTVTTVHYVVAKSLNRADANTAVSDLLEFLRVVPIDSADFSRAMAMSLRDFEDAVQVAAFLKVGANILVTRNERDFKGANITTRVPGEILALLT